MSTESQSIYLKVFQDCQRLSRIAQEHLTSTLGKNNSRFKVNLCSWILQSYWHVCWAYSLSVSIFFKSVSIGLLKVDAEQNKFKAKNLLIHQNVDINLLSIFQSVLLSNSIRVPLMHSEEKISNHWILWDLNNYILI